MATYLHQCEECGQPFESTRRDARFHNASCRVKANRRPAKAGKAKTAKKVAAAQQQAPDGHQLFTAGALLGQLLADLSKAGVLETIPGRAAAALAQRIESPMESGAAAAAMTRELSRLVEEAKALAVKQEDAIDEIDEAVSGKLRLVSGGIG